LAGSALPSWLVLLAVSRDGLIVGAVVLSSLMDNPVEMRPLMVSKANTMAQIVLLVLVLADLAGHRPARSAEQLDDLSGRGLDHCFGKRLSRHLAPAHGQRKRSRVNCGEGRRARPSEVRMTTKIDQRALRRQIFFWLLALGLFIAFMMVFRSILLPFIAGMALAYFLDPVADWFERRGLSRLMATIVILLAFIALFAISLIVIIPVLVTQAADLGGRIPGYITQLQELLSSESTIMPDLVQRPAGAGQGEFRRVAEGRRRPCRHDLPADLEFRHGAAGYRGAVRGDAGGGLLPAA
jgi:phosphatidylglycerophosphate synthase